MNVNLMYRLSAVAASLLAFGFVAQSGAAEPKDNDTVITVSSEMCGGCVKKITNKLKEISGVADVRCDAKAKTVKVVPARDTSLSPRTLWEAMEEIGKTPNKLVGPSGTFTQKPKK